MTRKAREIETLLLTMFAAVPLYLTYAVGSAPVAMFHAAMAGILLRVALGRTPELIPARVMRWLAIVYVPFYFVDWRFLGGTAIAASTHLVLFIAVYQPIESVQRDNQSQRLLTTALIFVASLATSTHISVLLFVVVFSFFMLRQLMDVSHRETVSSVEKEYAEPPTARAAGFYLAGAAAIGAALFPMLPRVRSPFMHGMAASLPGGAAALSESINFNDTRGGGPGDTTVVARVWMDQEARAFFAPIRLRGMVYDRFTRGEFKQSLRGLREVPSRDGTFRLAQPEGVTRQAILQMRPSRGKLYLPVGAYALAGLPARLYEGPARETYYTYAEGAVNLTVEMADRSEPLRLTRVTTMSYPVSAEVSALAHSIVGNETEPARQAARIEQYMVNNFRYLPNTAASARKKDLEQFLLRDRTGHCEYFAAGMVVLMTALDVPARIAGGFYGGRLNPLTGYYTIRAEDAHAWTEVWDGRRWLTFDSTPPDLRPGAQQQNRLREYLAAIGDSMTFVWDRYVLTFGLADQLSLVEDTIAWGREKLAVTRTALRSDLREVLSPRFISLMAILTMAGFAAIFFSRRNQPVFHALARQLGAYGIKVGPAMTVEDALRALREQQPDAAEAIEPIVRLYEEERFSPRQDRARAAAIRRRLTELRA